MITPEQVDQHSIMIHYGQAAFGWALYMVGKLWWYRDVYDADHNGLGLKEVGVYVKKNWITALFNGMLLVVTVPYAEWLWATAMDIFKKDWPFNDFVYVLAGGFILAIQLIADFVRAKKQK